MLLLFRAVVFRSGVRRPVTVSVKVPKTGTLADLKAAVERSRPGLFGASADVPVLQVHAVDLVACKVLQHQLSDIAIPDETPLTNLKESETIVMYQLPPRALYPQSPPPETVKQLYSIVTAKWKGNHKYYPGTITGVHEEGRFSVTFEDGDVDDNVSGSDIYPRELVIYDVCVMHR